MAGLVISSCPRRSVYVFVLRQGQLPSFLQVVSRTSKWCPDYSSNRRPLVAQNSAAAAAAAAATAAGRTLRSTAALCFLCLSSPTQVLQQ